MLPKSLIKSIRSLKLKKYRSELRSYVIEGEKIIHEAISENQKITLIIGTKGFLKNLKPGNQRVEIHEVTEKELGMITQLSSNSKGLALVKFPEESSGIPKIKSWVPFLDQINDPGNLGTIIRTADWFGMKLVICSPNSCDYLNPKSVMASKGSIFRVTVLYADLNEMLSHNININVIGAHMEAEPLQNFDWKSEAGILVFGNESNGISKEIAKKVKGYVKVPGRGGAESLNVAQSAAIIFNDLFVKGKIIT